MRTISWVAAVIIVAAVAWWVLGSDRGAAADEDDLRANVQKVADAVARDQTDAARKQAADVAKNADKADVMALFKPAKGEAGGYGIEKMLMGLTGKKPLTESEAAARAQAIEQAAYRTAAIGAITQAMKPDKDEGQWRTWAKDLEANARQLAKAARTKDPKEIKAAAAKVEGTCADCHAKFRDQ